MTPMSGRSTPSLGLLGGGPQIAAVVEAARARGWRVVSAEDGIAVSGQPPESWTAFLDGEAYDAVLVGADNHAMLLLLNTLESVLHAQPAVLAALHADRAASLAGYDALLALLRAREVRQ